MTTATIVPEFIAELDGGQLERVFGAMLSQVAAACIDKGRAGELSIDLKLKPIKGTHQVEVIHRVSYQRPTEQGKATEDAEATTVMYVGKGGAMSISQPDIFGAKKDQGSLLS